MTMRAYHTHPKFPFEDVEEAAAYIGQGLRKWGRVDVRQYKEKFGEVRVYCSLGFISPHHIIWPGYVANQYPWHWLWVADVYFPRWIARVLNWFVQPYHVWLYRRYYREAQANWRHIADEIVDAADYPELLRSN